MRSLIIVLVVVAFVGQLASISAAPASSLPSGSGEQHITDGEDICLTPGCVKAANEILKNMDNTVDPCDDFYRYSCGNWVDSQVIPEDKHWLSPFITVQEELDNKLRILIEREPQLNEPPIVEKMRNFYASCMDTDRLETSGNEPLLDVIRKLGGWPMLGESSGWTHESEESFNWLETLIKFRELGLETNVLFGVTVKMDLKNTRHYIIELDEVTLGMSSHGDPLQGINDPIVAAYYNLMVDSAVMLGANRLEAESQMMDALSFEILLANYTSSPESRSDLNSRYNKMKQSELSNIAPNIDWNKYLASVLVDNPLGPDDEVIVTNPDFFTEFDRLLVEVEPNAIANYMMWRVVLQTAHLLGKNWRERTTAYNALFTGQQQEAPRQEQCFTMLKTLLDPPLSALYAKNYFQLDSRQRAIEMVDYIKDELTTILKEVDWMDEETRRAAIEKADAIYTQVGYPDELLNDTIIEQFYSGLKLERTNYFNNVLHIQKLSFDKLLERLREPNIQYDWRNHPRAASVSAFYSPQDNSIEIPAGILQDVFFHRDRPNYLNFGAIGSIIGHELTHGFDNLGRQFDKEGNHRDWWGAETDSNFRERAQCFIEQYGNFTVPGTELKVNGVNTLGENIADNGGLKEAFRAYKRWVSRHGVEPKLPGLKLNQEQLFFVSTANVWCTKMRPEMQQLLVAIDEHSPSQLRVTGPMSNLKEFSETFNCPAGTPMNPTSKCSLW
uniref:Membrane metallo-endopeptidase-like 1 n=1 Tax=Aceria tosichella TaxID=561515 RepID=A0A6G1S6H5_9ACAR